VLTVRELTASDLEAVDQALPLNRLDQHAAEGSTYLIAWDDGEPVGHAHLASQGTHLGLPELQDVYVAPAHRRRGVAAALTEAAESTARARGCDRISLSVSRDGNSAARALYEKLGYLDAGIDPVRVTGTITLRGRPLEVDDTLLYLVKRI
jgi:ribosomal protein S18 acetylase RimI-like enzyme